MKVCVPMIIEAGAFPSGKPCHVVQTSSVAGLIPMMYPDYPEIGATSLSEDATLYEEEGLVLVDDDGNPDPETITAFLLFDKKS